jgi:hypothetical protein
MKKRFKEKKEKIGLSAPLMAAMAFVGWRDSE